MLSCHDSLSLSDLLAASATALESILGPIVGENVRSLVSSPRLVRLRSLSLHSAFATINTLNRLCFAPTALAGTRKARSEYPSDSKRSKIPLNSPKWSIPSGFSKMHQAGSTHSITSRVAGQSQRSSCSPLRFPARLAGWQGTPALTTVMRPLSSEKSAVRMSP